MGYVKCWLTNKFFDNKLRCFSSTIIFYQYLKEEIFVFHAPTPFL